MKARLIRLAAAFLLAGTVAAVAQDPNGKPGKDGAPETVIPDEGEKSSGKSSDREERGPSGDNRAAEDRGEKAQGRLDEDKKKDNSIAKTGKDANSAADNNNRRRERQSDTTNQSRDRKVGKGQIDGTKRSAKEQRAKEPETKAQIDAHPRDETEATHESDPKKGLVDAPSAKEGKNIQLSAEKRDRVRASLHSELKLRRDTKIDVDIHIGSRAPKNWTFVPIPAAVVAIVPEYRGYVVAYVEDDYVICDPDTYEIIAVLPADGSYASTGTSVGDSGSALRCSSGLTLTRDEQEYILSAIRLDDEEDITDVVVGGRVPSDIELHTFPDPIVERTGKLNGCRYFVVDERVAIVDPDADEVVLLIEND